MRNLTIALALTSTLLLSGCPKSGGGKWTEEDLATNPAANFHKALSYLQNPDKKTGIVDYGSAYTYFAKSADLKGGPKASFNAGWTAERLGNIAEAEKHYRAAWEADKKYEAAAFSLARILSEQGKNEEAAEIYKAKSEATPNDTASRNEYMGALIKSGAFDMAITEAQGILRKDPKNAETYRNLSALYYAQDNYSMSQLTAEKALELDDSNAGVYNNMGVTYLIQENEPAAIDKFKTAVKLDSNHYEANMNLGWVAVNSGDYTLALKSFEAATKANPASMDAKLGLAISKRGVKEYKAAEKIYDEIIENDPQTEAAYFNAAVLHEFYTKDFAKAEKYLQTYIDTHNVGPTHDVFKVMQRIQDAKAAEEARKAAEAEAKRLEEERAKRNAELLAGIAARAEALGKQLVDYAECLDPESVMEVEMVLEQALMVVEAEEVDMAPDIDQFLSAYESGVAAAVEGCEPSAGGGGEEAPPEEGAEGVEGGEEAPAEGAEGAEGGE